jgi:hypothetical protein
VVGDRTEWSYGRFGRFQGMSQNFSYTFSNNTLKEWKEKWEKFRNGGEEPEEGEESETTETAQLQTGTNSGRAGASGAAGSSNVDPDGYLDYTLPWSLSFSYGITMREDTKAKINEKNMRYPYKFTQNMNISGNVKLTNKWNINFSSGWDFVYKDFTTTTMSVTRDLHCFNMSCSVVLSPYTSYNFTVRANSSMLSDVLKLKKRSSSANAVTWY